jgi:hydroxymethylbilane synthase
VNSIRIATRKSKLAICQAEYVKHKLQSLYPKLEVKLIKLSSEGDRMLDVSLSKIGGKGLFIKEVEQALLNNNADIAVHSMKDMPAIIDKNFSLTTVCTRENPYDSLISNKYKNLEQLPYGAIVGTSSLRRESQILNIRPDLTIKFIRGNINSRIAKLDNQEYDAIILACAGLYRLNMQNRISQIFTAQQMLPAAAQGAICIEVIATNEEIKKLLQPINDTISFAETTAERAVSAKLNASCSTPIAAFAQTKNNSLTLEALVATKDGKQIIKSSQSGNITDAKIIGNNVAEDLLKQGAKKILDNLNH